MLPSQTQPPCCKNTHEDLAGVVVAERQAGVGDQVGQAVVAAQQTGLGVVGKAVLGALNGGLQRQGGRRASLVLRAGARGGAHAYPSRPGAHRNGAGPAAPANVLAASIAQLVLLLRPCADALLLVAAATFAIATG